jgi:hypothetical protein
MVSAARGVFLWHEFAEAPPGARAQPGLMFLFFWSGTCGGCARSHRSLVTSRYQKHDSAKALAAFRAGVKQNPHNAVVELLLAEALS